MTKAPHIQTSNIYLKILDFDQIGVSGSFLIYICIDRVFNKTKNT